MKYIKSRLNGFIVIHINGAHGPVICPEDDHDRALYAMQGHVRPYGSTHGWDCYAAMYLREAGREPHCKGLVCALADAIGHGRGDKMNAEGLSVFQRKAHRMAERIAAKLTR